MVAVCKAGLPRRRDNGKGLKARPQRVKSMHIRDMKYGVGGLDDWGIVGTAVNSNCKFRLVVINSKLL